MVCRLNVTVCSWFPWKNGLHRVPAEVIERRYVGEKGEGKMTDKRIKLFLAVLWAAAIILLIGGRIAYEITGVPAYGYLSMAYFVIINLIA